MDVQVLTRCALFAHIAPEELESMLHCLRAREFSVEKHAYLPDTRDAMPWLGVVLEGSIQMLSEDPFGRKSILAILTQDQLFGESFSCAQSKNRILSFQARERSRVLLLDYDRVLHTCKMPCRFHHRLIETMVELIARKNLELIEKIEVISCSSIREKVLTYLLRLRQEQGTSQIKVPFGRGEWAEYLCVDRSALTRELSRMKDEGLLSYQKRVFTIKGES